MTNQRGTRRGFTLIEMMCVIMLLTVLTGVLALMLREALRAGSAQTAGFDRILAVNALADAFRADVAQAEDAPAAWQQYKADAATLILRMPEASHVVYVWQKGTLWRRAVEDGETSERQVEVGSEQAGDRQVDVTFVREAGEAKLVRLCLQAMHNGSPLAGQALTITAALGGDRR
jgi:prepilin-type N-terminal cleavage/methylation domain-containing protein